MKPNLWIISFNPMQTSFLFYPWLFDVPLAFKPTYLNVSADLSAINMTDLFNDGQWDSQLLSLSLEKIYVPNSLEFA